MGLYFILSILSAAIHSPQKQNTADASIQQPVDKYRAEFAGVAFEKGKINLDDESKVALRLFVRTLNKESLNKSRFIVMGLAKNEDDKNLAFQRAKTVAEYLMKNGISPQTIQVQAVNIGRNLSMPIEIYITK